MDAQLRELRDRLAAAESGRQAAEQHARALEKEVRNARQQQGDAPLSAESFGFRAEKILRLAEHEAADVRNRAANEATALVEQARADAERHRHEVEQKLIARSAEMDQEAAQRNVAIQEREQQPPPPSPPPARTPPASPRTPGTPPTRSSARRRTAPTRSASAASRS
ncbi:hypothetical protein BJF78_18020 [Pseudonocardia sp. CNS-139]|nr:hypothetical protein BJF78_18020 [Pseudonocardia sp. CNS-139]